MPDKPIAGKLVDQYWALEEAIISLEGTGLDDQVLLLRNMQIELDKTLTNISKRWAKGKRQPVQKLDNTL